METLRPKALGSGLDGPAGARRAASEVPGALWAAMRARARRLLAKYDYPPDLEDKAVELVLGQAELFAAVEASGS